MIIDFFGYISKHSNEFDSTSFEHINLDYFSNTNAKIIKGESFSIKVHYTKSLNDSYCNSDGIKVLVMGNPIIDNNAHSIFNAPKKNITKANRILILYREKKEKIIQYLKGSFILIILDELLNKYYFVNDKMGLYDLLYFHNNQTLFFSTNLTAFNKACNLKLKLDPLSVIQYFLFDYPLGEYTFLEGVHNVKPGNYLMFDQHNISFEQYFSYLDLLLEPPQLSWEETLKQIPNEFNNVVDILIDKHIKICAGLTSGFDSRANLSRLVNHSNKDVLYYSWGLPISKEIKIASMITNKLGLNYEPIFLTEDFEKKYEYFAHQSIILSNGKGTITRANHGYGYNLLSQHSDFFFTGLMGSELIKPRNCGGYMFTQLLLDLLFINSREKREKLLEKEYDKLNYLRIDAFLENKENFLSRTKNYFDDYNTLQEFHLRLYYFMLKDGFRNYFGHEVHTNRIYGSIVSPYADDDFIKFILNSPIPDLNKKAFKNDYKSKLKGSQVYLSILRQNFPLLMNMRTGRHFKPKDLDSPFVYFYLLKSFLYNRINKLWIKDDTFDSIKWTNTLINRNEYVLKYNNEIIKINKFDNLEYKDRVKLYSIKFLCNYLINE